MSETHWEYRVGLGEDVHALVPGRPLMLGGVEVAHHAGLLGHSDADALLHAITDALLGAAGLGDIGAWFPDDDPRWRGVDSRTLLEQAVQGVRRHGWEPVNVDCTIHAQAPRLAGYRESMREAIAAALGIESQGVNVKAKTAERLGFVGRQEGIAASAVCLLRRPGR
jgi:2-C-methyl-D-erythritol 2,4-cyclodiphosphate synthase